MSSKSKIPEGPPNEEELKILQYLESIRQSDPQLFAKTMTALGGVGGDGDAQSTSSTSEEQSKILLEALAASLKNDKNGGLANSSLNLPGMTKILGKDGLEDRVSHALKFEPSLCLFVLIRENFLDFR